MWHGFGSYSTPYWSEPDASDNDDAGADGFDEFCERLREVLPEDEAFTYLEAGHENLRYLIGGFTVVTKETVRWGNISDLAVREAKDILGSGFETRLIF